MDAAAPATLPWCLLRCAVTLPLVVLLCFARLGSAQADATDEVRRIRPGLLADAISVAYGERSCGQACTAELARRLRASGDVGGLCAEALLGTVKLPPPQVPWVSLLRSHLPVWGLLRRQSHLTGVATDADMQEGLPELWFNLLPAMRSAMQNGWRSGVARAFSRIVRGLQKWPSLLMRAEMMLQVANALRLGELVFNIVGAKEPSPRLVYEAGDYFISRAQNLLLNATGGLRYTERIVALLQHNEFMRITAFDLLETFTPRDPVVIFGGAHQGAVLTSVLSASPRAKVYGFEADPYVFQVLEMNFRDNPRVVPFHRALYSRDGMQLEIRTRNGIGSQSTLFAPTKLFEETWPWINWGTTETVETIALEPWARREGVRSVDFIYMDIECAELAALRGARQLLANVTMVHLEVSNEPLCDGGPLWPEVRRFMRSRGFEVLWMPPRPWQVRFDVAFLRLPLPEWARSGAPSKVVHVAAQSAAARGSWDWADH